MDPKETVTHRAPDRKQVERDFFEKYHEATTPEMAVKCTVAKTLANHR